MTEYELLKLRRSHEDKPFEDCKTIIILLDEIDRIRKLAKNLEGWTGDSTDNLVGFIQREILYYA